MQACMRTEACDWIDCIHFPIQINSDALLSITNSYSIKSSCLSEVVTKLVNVINAQLYGFVNISIGTLLPYQHNCIFRVADDIGTVKNVSAQGMNNNCCLAW